MKIVKENNGDVTPLAGCICSSGSKDTRGIFPPIISCKCNCIGYGTETSNANTTKASNS